MATTDPKTRTRIMIVEATDKSIFQDELNKAIASIEGIAMVNQKTVLDLSIISVETQVVPTDWTYTYSVVEGLTSQISDRWATAFKYVGKITYSYDQQV